MVAPGFALWQPSAKPSRNAGGKPARLTLGGGDLGAAHAPTKVMASINAPAVLKRCIWLAVPESKKMPDKGGNRAQRER